MEKSDRVKIVTNNHQSRTSDFSIVEGLSSEFSFSFNLPTKLPPEEKSFKPPSMTNLSYGNFLA